MIKIEENKVTEQKANGWLIALSIIIPLAGLIIFISQKDKQPKTAKTCGICALISFIVSTVIIFIFVLLISIGITTFTRAQDVIIDDITTSSENKLIEKSKEATVKNKIEAAKDTVSLYINDAKLKYMTEKYSGNDEVDISKYLIEALKKAKRELSNNGITLTASGNTVYLSYEEYTVTGTISDNGNITWSDIEEK